MKNKHADLILNHIKTHGSITSKEAFELFGCTRLSVRIFDLREKGIAIKTENRTEKNRYGAITTYAVYKLEEAYDEN